MARTYVIGDIHGCCCSLTKLLQRLSPDPIEDTLVFLGDYVDRGPESAQVLDLLLELSGRQRMIPLMGNHEQLFLDFLQGGNQEYFLHLGGRETLASYNITTWPVTREQLGRVPTAHINFLRGLHLYWEDQHAIYVHAGLQPGRHLSQQQVDWCLWVRDKFITSPHDFGKPVIFGHTVFSAPLVQANKIGIDTGAVYGGSLTCLVLPEREFIQVAGECRSPYLWNI